MGSGKYPHTASLKTNIHVDFFAQNIKPLSNTLTCALSMRSWCAQPKQSLILSYTLRAMQKRLDDGNLNHMSPPHMCILSMN